MCSVCCQCLISVACSWSRWLVCKRGYCQGDKVYVWCCVHEQVSLCLLAVFTHAYVHLLIMHPPNAVHVSSLRAPTSLGTKRMKFSSHHYLMLGFTRWLITFLRASARINTGSHRNMSIRGQCSVEICFVHSSSYLITEEQIYSMTTVC